MCKFAQKLQESRTEQGISQQQIAAQLCVSQSTWSKYETGELNIPEDIAFKAILYLNDSRLREFYSYHKKTNVINIPPLNNVDMNNITIGTFLIEESEELIYAIKQIMKIIRNKSSREEITDKEWEMVLKYEEQIVDILPAVNMHLVQMNRVYKLDLGRLELRMAMKLKDKKYIV